MNELKITDAMFRHLKSSSISKSTKQKHYLQNNKCQIQKIVLNI